MIKILIVEDEVIIAETISKAIESFGHKSLESAINFTSAIRIIEEEIPDIGIFDIQLSGNKTGIDLANIVNEKYNFPFIFLTSNSDKLTLEEAKKSRPSAFLVKPFNDDELYVAIELAIYNYSNQNKKTIKSINKLIENAIFIKTKMGYERLNLSDILFLKSDNVYIDIVTKDSKIHVVRATIGEYMDKLNDNFLRIHRSYIINLNYLDRVGNNSVKVEGEEIPIGKKYKEDLISMMSKG